MTKQGEELGARLGQKLVEWLDQGLRDEEIVDLVERWWIWEHTPLVSVPATGATAESRRWHTWTRGTPPSEAPLWIGRAARDWLAEHRDEANEPPTQAAQQFIPKLYATWREIEHEERKPSRSKVAQLVGVDRDTVKRWIDKGWMELPPPK